MLSIKQEGYFLLKNFTKDYLILKNRNPKLIQMQNRLNKRLNQISKKLVDRTMNDVTINPMRYDDRIKAAYKETLTQVYKAGEYEVIKNPQVELTTSVLRPDKLTNIIQERTFRASEYTMNRLTGDVLPRIKEGIREGQTLEKTTETLRNEFTDMTNTQLQRISRTETHSTYNQSKYDAMMQSTAVKGKRWLSSGLANSREWHEEANGQTQYVEDPFQVMDEPLDYPGAPEGSPENIINCACTMTPIIREEEITGE